MRISKKILAAVLAALMVISMMPFTALAATVEVNSAESFESAIASANAGDTIKLTGDVTFDYPSLTYTRLDVGGLTIDLNGYTITSYNNGVVYAGSNYTIKNGNMTCANGGSYALCIVAEDYDDCENWNVSKKGTNVVAEDLILEGGVNVWASEVTLRNVTAHGTKYYAVWADEDDTVVTVESGSYSSDCTANGAGSKCVIAAAKDHAGTLNIEGGTYTVAEGQTIVLTGATRDVVISGGSFVNEENEPLTVPAQYIADGATQENGVVTQTYVAKIGTDYYATVEDAAAASQEGDTITLVADDDMSVRYPTTNYTHHIELNGVTLDLNGHTITNVSHGTMWLCKNAVIKNGTFAGKKATSDDRYYALSIWGKNVEELGTETTEKGYNVTVENVTAIGGINVYYHENVVLKNCTCTGKMYYAVFVNQDTDVTIESGSYSPAANITALVGAAQYPGSSLTIKGGNFTVPAGKPLVLNNAGKNRVVISGGFYHYDNESVYTVLSNNVANGYKQDLTTGEVIADNDVDTMSITIKDNIDLNIYVADSADEIETIEFSYNTTPGVEENNQETTVVPATKNADGKIALKVDLAPAQIMDEIKVVAKKANGDTVKTIETSVADYCNRIISETGFTQELKDLAVSTLDYGKAASDYFDYNTSAFNSYTNQLGEADLSGLTQSDNNWYNTGYFTLTGVSYVATSTPELRFYIDMTTTTENNLTWLNDEIETNNIGTARFVKDAEGNMMLQIKGIDITNFNELIVVKFKNDDTELLKFTPITWVKMAQNDEQLDDLANAIGNYYLKSVAYFD